MTDSYNPITGEHYTQDEARERWSASMARSGPRWQLDGEPGAWAWAFFTFRPYAGLVTVEADGFHWATRSYDTGETIHAGVTTSVYEAYQSVEQNRPVEPRLGFDVD